MAASTDIWSCLEHMCPQLAPLTERRSRTTLAEQPIIPSISCHLNTGSLFIPLACNRALAQSEPGPAPPAPGPASGAVHGPGPGPGGELVHRPPLLIPRLAFLRPAPVALAALCAAQRPPRSLSFPLTHRTSAAVHGPAQPALHHKSLPALAVS